MPLQARAEATRRRILDSAIDLFDELGYGETGLADVLQRAGVSKGAFYYHFDSKEAVAAAIIEDYRRHVTDPIDLLSPREREVLRMIAESKTNKEIAQALSLSVYTVEAHRGRIMEKLNLHSIAELVRFALRKGLID